MRKPSGSARYFMHGKSFILFFWKPLLLVHNRYKGCVKKKAKNQNECKLIVCFTSAVQS